MVVQGGAEVIAGGYVATAQNHVPETFRVGPGLAERPFRFGIAKRERTGLAGGFRDIEAQGEGMPGGLALGRKNRIETAASSGIDHRLALMGRTGRRGDVLPAAETGIDEVHGLQTIERRSIVVEMLRLPTHRLFPVEAEPGEVVVDCRFEFGTAARAVDVLDAEEEAAFRGLGYAPAEQRGIGMAEVEMACRTGRESRNNPGSRGRCHDPQH